MIRRRRDAVARPEEPDQLARPEEPNPAVALAVGLIYVFRTSAGARLMRELEGAVRKYAADPQALWKLVREGEPPPERGDVIDTTAVAPRELPPEKK